MPQAILTLNAGSSSLKFALFKVKAHQRLEPLLTGQVEGIPDNPHFIAIDQAAQTLGNESWPDRDFDRILHNLLGWIETHLGASRLIGIGHRVVHGGPLHDRPELVTATRLDMLDRLEELAPLHVPHNVKPIRELARARPDIPQVACFDTAFHHTVPVTD